MPWSTGRRKVQSGTGKGRAGVGGMIAVNVTPGSSLLASETNLGNATIDAKTLYKTGQACRIFAAGRTAANGNNKQVKLYISGVEVFDTGTVAGNGVAWYIEAYLVKTGVDTQKIVAHGILHGGTFTCIKTDLTFPIDTTPSTALTVAVTGIAATADADVTRDITTVEVLAA